MNAHDASELAYKNGYVAGYKAARYNNKSKEYKLLDGRSAVFLYNDDGIGTISVELMDELMGEINKLTAERDALLEKIDHRCEDCKHYGVGLKKEPCKGCFKISPHPYIDHANWEWRGVT